MASLLYPTAKLLCVSLGFWRSFKALKRQSLRSIKSNVVFWVVITCFSVVELLADACIGWIPFFNETKFALILWLILAQTSASNTLYRTFVKVFFARRETAIDGILDHVHQFMIERTADVSTALDMMTNWYRKLKAVLPLLVNHLPLKPEPSARTTHMVAAHPTRGQRAQKAVTFAMAREYQTLREEPTSHFAGRTASTAILPQASVVFKDQVGLFDAQGLRPVSSVGFWETGGAIVGGRQSGTGYGQASMTGSAFAQPWNMHITAATTTTTTTTNPPPIEYRPSSQNQTVPPVPPTFFWNGPSSFAATSRSSHTVQNTLMPMSAWMPGGYIDLPCLQPPPNSVQIHATEPEREKQLERQRVERTQQVAQLTPLKRRPRLPVGSRGRSRNVKRMTTRYLEDDEDDEDDEGGEESPLLRKSISAGSRPTSRLRPSSPLLYVPAKRSHPAIDPLASVKLIKKSKAATEDFDTPAPQSVSFKMKPPMDATDDPSDTPENAEIPAPPPAKTKRVDQVSMKGTRVSERVPVRREKGRESDPSAIPVRKRRTLRGFEDAAYKPKNVLEEDKMEKDSVKQRPKKRKDALEESEEEEHSRGGQRPKKRSGKVTLQDGLDNNMGDSIVNGSRQRRKNLEDQEVRKTRARGVKNGRGKRAANGADGGR